MNEESYLTITKQYVATMLIVLATIDATLIFIVAMKLLFSCKDAPYYCSYLAISMPIFALLIFVAIEISATIPLKKETK